VQEFNNSSNEFMNECLSIIQEDIKSQNYEDALYNIESNMNELIYDYKELERNKDEETEEEYKANVAELKTNIRFLTFYKLSMKVLLLIADYKTSDNKEMVASLANILVLPPVDQEVKKYFYSIALKENINCKNYKIALKLLKSYDKQITSNTEQENEFIEGIRHECEEFKSENLEKFHSVDCPKCRENLPFGHATPHCQKCNSKILFCNETLAPLIPETACRCHI
jgi:hypothetical protein